MKFNNMEEFKNYIITLIGKNSEDLTQKFFINGWEFKHLKGNITEEKTGNVYTWEHIFSNDQIKQSVKIECITRYIKSKDILKIKDIKEVVMY